LSPAAVRAEDAATRQLAHRIVVEVLDSKPGDVVLITSSVQNNELLEDLKIELNKVGAFGIVDLFSDRVNRAYAALPAGEVIFGPAPLTARGTVVLDTFFFNNTEVDGFKMVLAGGKVTSMTANSGMSAIQPFYDSSTAGKDAFTFADFGLNPGVKYLPGTKMSVFMASGMVSLGIGGDLGIGGTNASTFGLAGTISGATVTVDGKPLIVKGTIVR
jgi:leucyl aminopeptidase (aminopeptidase T)